MSPLAVDVFSAALPLFLKVSRISVRARLHTHENATLFDTSFAVFDALLGDVPPETRSNKTIAGRTSAATRERRRA